MWRRVWCAAFAAFISVGLTAQAAATIIDITYTGQIFGGTANASDGTFCGGFPCSASGYSFSGQAFALNYIFDTSLGTVGNNSYTNIGTSSELSGGSNAIIGFVPPVGYATGLPSISGFDPAVCNIVACSAQEHDTASAGSTYNQFVSWSFFSNTGGTVGTSLFANSAIPGDITTAFSLSGPNIGSGSFSSFSSPGGECGTPEGWRCQDGNLQIESVVVTSFETPLPAALPLFATGLGALGLLGWRRKRKVSATAIAAG